MTVELTLVERIVLAVFVCYRLAELFAFDDGPYMIFSNLQQRLKNMSNRRKGVFTQLALLDECPFCLGIWFALLLTPIVIFPSVIGNVFMIFLAIAGVQTFLEQHSIR